MDHMFTRARDFDTVIPFRENHLLWLNHKTPVWLPDQLSEGYAIRIPAVLEQPEGQDGYDWFGCHWTWDSSVFGAVCTPGRTVLADIEDWKKADLFPDLDAVNWEKDVSIDPQLRKERLTFFCSTAGPFERLHHVLGFENALTALVISPEACYDFMDAVANYKIDLFKRIMHHFGPIDLFRCNDDWGTQRAGFFSEEMFLSTILPHTKKIVDFVHGEGCFYLQHTCGYQANYMSHSIAAGIDNFEIQESANDIGALLTAYGDKANFNFRFALNFAGEPEMPETQIIERIHPFVDAHAGSGGVSVKLGAPTPDMEERCARDLYYYSMNH